MDKPPDMPHAFNLRGLLANKRTLVVASLVLSFALVVQVELQGEVTELEEARSNQARKESTRKQEQALRREYAELFRPLVTEPNRTALSRLKTESAIRALAASHESTLEELLIDVRREVSAHPELQGFQYGLTSGTVEFGTRDQASALVMLYRMTELPGFASSITSCRLALAEADEDVGAVRSSCKFSLMDIAMR